MMINVKRRRASANYRLAVVIATAVLMPCHLNAQAAPEPEQANVKHVRAFDLPLSSLLDPRDRDFIVANEGRPEEVWRKLREDYADCMRRAGMNPSQSEARKFSTSTEGSENRDCNIYARDKSQFYLHLRERFPVKDSLEKIGGIPVEIFEPRAGIDRRNRNRVLINLHGGGFVGGSRISSHLESIPIAALGRFRIVSVDYRLASDAKFPAASEDVAAVYSELLKRYKPGNIAIFGCSAGGLLAAQTVAWLDHKKIPLPGAIAISGSGASYYTDGDSARFAHAIYGGVGVWQPVASNPYFGPQAASDPLALPLQSDAIMGRFPPSLFLTATRDLAMSSAVKTHQTLTRLGRETDLHVWEGLGHCFAAGGQNSPAANELWALTIEFFNKHLGR